MGKPPFLRHTFTDSSNVRSYVYNYKTRELDVTFAGNRKYRYYSVEERIAESFQHAPSAGKFLNEILVKGSYQFEKLS